MALEKQRFLTLNLMSLHDCNVYPDPKGGFTAELEVNFVFVG